MEIIKLLIVLFMAAYLAETADVHGGGKPWSLRANAKYLGPLFHRLGRVDGDSGLRTRHRDGELLLATFAAMLYVATRRIDLIAGGSAIFALAVWLGDGHYPYVVARFEAWRNPFADPFGTAIKRCSRSFRSRPAGCSAPATASVVPTSFPPSPPTTFSPRGAKSSARSGRGAGGAVLVLVIRALRAAHAQPDFYGKLLATGLAATFGFQTFIIVGGVLALFPLTGITLPFVSYGGSSLVANFLLVALVWAISSERRRRADETKPASA